MTFILPQVDKPGKDLSEATKEALELGIRACGPGKRLNGIGKVIEWVKRGSCSEDVEIEPGRLMQV